MESSAGTEAALRQRLTANPADADAAIALSELLVMSDRALAAREVLAPFAQRPDADIYVLTADAEALKSLRRFDEAAHAYERARDAAPKSAVAEHNLAGVLGDMQRYAESEEATRRAFSKGLDAPETWLVRGRALQGLGAFDEAAQAFREAIHRRQTYADAHADLAQLVWMRTENAALAGEVLNAAIRANPTDAPLRLKKAQFLEYVADRRLAYAVLGEAPAAVRAAPEVEAVAAQLASWFDPGLALDHARRAYAAAPQQQLVLGALCQAALAAGEARAAAEVAEVMRARWPLNQYAIALIATAWRMLGDPRYRALYDYDAMVSVEAVDTPKGWARLEDFLGDLAKTLEGLHRFTAHPIGQSLRLGAQTHITPSTDDPVIRGYFEAIDGPIRRRLAALGGGADPVRARNAGGYQFNGVWSVALRPAGRHENHVHPMGWLSSASYVALPEAVHSGREGWIKFGEPGIPTAPVLEPEHFVKPKVGELVLFPSYMWHGTVPFGGDQPRLTIAFDLLPA
jgi:hypothetical protein